jgi:DNA (cytosine-5)-methyltransferase 3A
MKVLSLFDGISCGRIALERANIPVEKYYASEIDKYAIQVSNKNYPDIIHIGDITKLDFNDYKDVDLIIGGSPCQDLSIAKNNRQGLNGSKSSLFYKFVEAIETIKPKYFMLENVASMSKENKDIITKILGVEPVLINSSLVSAQQRKRLYWCNWKVEQPQDRGIYLKDILEDDATIDERMVTNGKSYSLTASYSGAVAWNGIEKKQRTMVNQPIVYKQDITVKVRKYKVDIEELKNTLQSNRIKSINELSIELNIPKTTVEHWFRKDNSFSIPESDIWFKLKELLKIKTDIFDKSITEFEIRDGNYDMSKRVYDIQGKSPTLTTLTGGQQHKIIFDNYQIRKLTPIECEKLQTLPIDYTASVSNTQRYKCIGNGWTVDVISHILGGIK